MFVNFLEMDQWGPIKWKYYMDIIGLQLDYICIFLDSIDDRWNIKSKQSLQKETTYKNI